MTIPTFDAMIRWVSREDGGRVRLPIGPIYYGAGYVLDPGGDQITDYWSTVLEYPESLNQPMVTKGTFRFLVEEAPHQLLTPGTHINVCEGRAVVAHVEILA